MIPWLVVFTSRITSSLTNLCPYFPQRTLILAFSPLAFVLRFFIFLPSTSSCHPSSSFLGSLYSPVSVPPAIPHSPIHVAQPPRLPLASPAPVHPCHSLQCLSSPVAQVSSCCKTHPASLYLTSFCSIRSCSSTSFPAHSSLVDTPWICVSYDLHACLSSISYCSAQRQGVTDLPGSCTMVGGHTKY